ncbi:hypothetical protein MTO96_049384 [Rhipicephalus appendiculatus]
MRPRHRFTRIVALTFDASAGAPASYPMLAGRCRPGHLGRISGGRVRRFARLCGRGGSDLRPFFKYSELFRSVGGLSSIRRLATGNHVS